MGSPPDEAGRQDDKEAQVDVKLSKGFWIGQYEVTQGEWNRIVPDIPRTLIPKDGDDFPVYWVNFYEAEEFCHRLTQQAHASGQLPAGWEFRLPTEAQWEYACRSGTTTAFAFGDTLTSRNANIEKPYNGDPDSSPGSATTRVGSYPPNAWGICDMHGNEDEWCRDIFEMRLPGGVDPDLHDDTGMSTRSRVRRGGCWPNDARFCRSASRAAFEPERRANHIGFRVVIVRL
jgi:formylglycine-generating enzyme required for sulfatase activity